MCIRTYDISQPVYPPLCVCVSRPDQGSAEDGRSDPLAGPGAVPAEISACYGSRLQLRHLPGGSPGMLHDNITSRLN